MRYLVLCPAMAGAPALPDSSLRHCLTTLQRFLYSIFNQKTYLCYVGVILRRSHSCARLMDSVRWQKITSVFQAAREMPLADRPAYLEKVCAADVELRQQVERLLLNDVDESTF